MKKTLKMAILLCLTVVVMLVITSCDTVSIQVQTGNQEITNEDVTTPGDVTTPTPHEHALEPVISAFPTCTETGLIEGKTCIICGDFFKQQEIIPATGHTKQIIPSVIPQSCIETGLTEGEKCADCDEILKAQETIPATEHTWWFIPAKEATCIDPGCIAHERCFNCGETMVSMDKPDVDGEEPEYSPPVIMIPALGHDFVGDTCTRCGEVGWFTGPIFELNDDRQSYRLDSYGYLDFGESEIVIPSTYNGLPVTVIGEYVFGRDGTGEMTRITIPNSVTSIDNHAFYNCRGLMSIVFEEGSQLTSIGKEAFSNCSSLASVTIPDSVTTIGEGAFIWCESLTSVTIPDSVTTIGEQVFSRCASLTSFIVAEESAAYRSINGDLYTKDGTMLVAYAVGKTATSFIIPDSVTTICIFAFADCDSLTSVTIPASVTTIGNWAFYCSNLTRIIFEGTVEQWNAIQKIDQWTDELTIEVVCSNGTVPLY